VTLKRGREKKLRRRRGERVFEEKNV